MLNLSSNAKILNLMLLFLAAFVHFKFIVFAITVVHIIYDIRVTWKAFEMNTQCQVFRRDLTSVRPRSLSL